jgi:ethanolamine ammonia-lyase small subunit
VLEVNDSTRFMATTTLPASDAPAFLPSLITPTPWESLKKFTDARIALGRAGVSQPTSVHLAFQLAHAQARDAVHLPLDAHGLATALQGLGSQTLMLHSRAPDRLGYLQRPDLGRRLDEASVQAIATWMANVRPAGGPPFDLAFVVVDGLSALAIHDNATSLVSLMLGYLKADASQAWSVAPLVVVEQGRVAIGDDIAEQLNARMVVVLIGERPGLSSPDSMGIYFTWAPRVGTLDAARNCISNVRAAGLSVPAAAQTLQRLLTQARLQQATGITLKDELDHQLPNAATREGSQPYLTPWLSASTAP